MTLKHKYLISAFILASCYWFFDSTVHYFIYNESNFEWLPSEFNELWMRLAIVILILSFGAYIDYSLAKLLEKEKRLESVRVYTSMLNASHHITNNLLNQMQLIRLEAERHEAFDPEVIKLHDDAVKEAQVLLENLSDVIDVSSEAIWQSVDPANNINKDKL
jgi:hypothetical protein